MDATLTPMGKRLLRAWMLRPSIDATEIGGRLDAVEAGVKSVIIREQLRQALDGVLDLERLLSRVTLETANPRDLLALAASLAKIPGVKAAVSQFGTVRTMSLSDLLDELADLRQRVQHSRGATFELCRWRRDRRGRGRSTRRTPRPEPQ
jgi:DNA mismatch repair protein MutS